MPGWFRIRSVMSCFVALGSVALATASLASNLKDVRVGPHGEYTRVVLETDTKTPYALTQADGVVTIELQASAAPKAVTAKSQQLSWVRVEPAGGSSVVKIQLKGPARVKQMVLTGPHRIVLDVYGGAPATKPTSQPAPLSESKPTELSPVPFVEEQPEPARAVDEDAAVMAESVEMLGPVPTAVAGDEIAANEGAEIGRASCRERVLR